MFRKLGIGFAALTMLAPGLASALGVGDYQLKSYLNQPFEMEVELIDVRDLAPEEVLVALASQQEFDAVGIERSYFLTDLEFEVTLDGQGGGTLRVYSTQPVREPYLSFLVEFLWPTGRLMREYTVLLDPPSYAESLRGDTAEASAPSRAVAAEAPATDSAPVVQEATAAEPRIVASSQADREPIEVVDRQEYVVQTDDTMWRIALNNRPAQSISVQQMLLAIQSLNEDAFIDGNVNLVREGTVLRMPTEDEVRRISTREALGEIAEQNREWRARLEARGIRLPTRPQMDATGRTAAADTGGDVASQAGEVTLVAPTDSGSEGAATGTGAGGGSGADSRALENELAIRDERVDQLRRQNEELTSRLNDLSQQVQTSEQLLKLRNDQIAKLQDELRKLQEAQGLEPTEPVVVEPVTPTDIEPTTAQVTEAPEDAGQEAAEAGTDETATDAADAMAESEAETAGAAEEGEAAAEPQVAEPVAAPERPKPVASPAPVAQPSFLEENLMLVVAAGAVVVLLVFGGLFIAARRRRAAAESAVQDEDLAAYGEDEEDFFAADMGAEDDDLGDAFAEAPADSQSAAAGQDPLEEVDVYTAYGRHAEAVTFLKNEIRKAPERADLKVRLLEVLAEMRDVATFEREANAFAGEPEVERRLPDLRAQLGVGAAGAVAADAASEPSLDDLEFDLASDFDSKPSKPAAQDDDATLVLDTGSDLDFSTDLSDDTASGQPAEDDMSIDFGGEDTLSLEGGDEEFSLDLEDEAEPAVDSARQQELDEALSVAPALKLSDSSGPQDEDVDFGDIALEDASEEFSEVAETPSTEELDLSLDDIDFGMEEPAAAAPAAAKEELELSLESDDELSLGGEEELSLDGGDELSLSLEDEADDLSLELETPDATVQRSAIDDLELGGAAATDVRPAVEAQPQGLSLDEEDDFEFLGDADENATKLDLAKAYIDMGDAEGARDILGEVIAEGNSAQQAEAKELLAQVS